MDEDQAFDDQEKCLKLQDEMLHFWEWVNQQHQVHQLIQDHDDGTRGYIF